MDRHAHYAEVIVDIAHSDVDKIFDYILPDGMMPPAGSRVLVPFGNTTVEGFVLGVKKSTDVPPEKIKAVIREIDDMPIITEEQMRLAHMMVSAYRTTMAFALRLMFPNGMRRERIKKRTVRMIAAADADALAAARDACFTKDGRVRAKNRLKTIDAIMREDMPSALLDSPSVKKLIELGAAREYQKEEQRRPYTGVRAGGEARELTEDQRAAVAAINEAVDAGSRQTLLLRGVTGSGKTEVYMWAAEHALSEGKGVIVLVPEISLTPQIFSEFQGRFGDIVAVFHSALSEGERFDEWRRVRSGDARIVLGARSAVFMPVENLGLIIIDEEHAESYKAEKHPPYHAAEVSRMRAGISGAALLLASATPRIESYMKARAGVYKLIEMNNRVKGLNMPAMSIVDMKREFVRGNRSLISAELHADIDRVLKRGEQALLFLNRRGYASSLLCPSCGHVRMCPSCDMPLKYHKSTGTLVCHYCGREYPFKRECPECGERFTRLTGIGTERVAEEVKKFFPNARVLRMDFDTTRTKDSHAKIYEAFKRGEADILVGTQMISRGLDFGNVTLAAVMSADSMLSFGGYRAAENAFSMIEQVGGRAGRAAAGKVIVQTFDPNHYAIRFAKTHDYVGFYTAEAAFRKTTNKPPFTRMYRLVFTHESEEKVRERMEVAAKLLEEKTAHIKDDVIMLTAGMAPVCKLEGKSRSHVLMNVRAASAKYARAALLDTWEELKGGKVQISMDIDPYDIY